MPDFAAAIANAGDTLKRLGGVTVAATYWRGDWAIPIKTQRGQTEHETTDSYGVVTTARTDDFLLDADDLTIAGQQIDPAPGDRIVLTANNRLDTYEVGHPTAADPFSRHGPSRQRLRVHTRLVSRFP